MKIKKYVSAPVWIYLFAIVAAVVLCIFCENCSCLADFWEDLFINIAYGCFSSVIVALPIDIANTAVYWKKQYAIYNRIVAGLQEDCSELPSEIYTEVYEAFGYHQNGKHTYDEWTAKLFSAQECGYTEKQRKSISYIVSSIKNIELDVTRLQGDVRNFISNECFTKEFENTLKRLKQACIEIKVNASREQYAICGKILRDRIKQEIIRLFPELTNDYLREYNEEEYI